jgi:hypothetical protein
VTVTLELEASETGTKATHVQRVGWTNFLTDDAHEYLAEVAEPEIQAGVG